MKLSVIVPVYNERNTIQEILRRVRAVDLGEISKEIIVVDDGSTDGTVDILKLEEDPTTRLLRRPACSRTRRTREKAPPSGPGWSRQPATS